jgi:hypothetical protein
MRAFTTHSTIEAGLPDEVGLLGGELALSHAWVARVSRLIGKFDTTGKVHLWQVGFLAVSVAHDMSGGCSE